MRRYVIVILTCLGAAIGAGALAAAAMAGPPEFGRCVKHAGGKYATSNCTTEEAGKNKFEWEPGPGPTNRFTTRAKPLTTVTFETVGKTKIECTGETGGGEIKNAKEVADVVFRLTGCSSLGTKCASVGAVEGEIVTDSLGGLLGVETTNKNKVLEDLRGENAGEIFTEFACAGVAIVVRGSVLHQIKAINRMVKETTEKFTGRESHLEESISGGPFERVGFLATLLQTYQAKIEVNTVV